MGSRPRHLPRRLLIGLAYLAVGCKLLIPVGFMPAAFGDGGFTLCPDASPLVFLTPEDDRQPRNAIDDPGMNTDQCPFGAPLQGAPPVAEYGSLFDSPHTSLLPTIEPRPAAGVEAAPFSARAPPPSFA